MENTLKHNRMFIMMKDRGRPRYSGENVTEVQFPVSMKHNISLVLFICGLGANKAKLSK